VLKGDEIMARIERLAPEARALFGEIWWLGEETEGTVPPEEVLAGDVEQRLAELPIEAREEVFDLFGAIGRHEFEEVCRLQAEGDKSMRIAALIQQAQDLDRNAGRPVNQSMTLGEAIPKLEAAGKMDPLERKYLDSVKDELVWVPVSEEDE
jgi:hypothetical protein